MEELRISYKQIEDANNEINTMKIGNKDYATVNERVKAFRKVYPNGTVETEIEELTENTARIKATIRDEKGDVIATGRASEIKKGMVNSTSMIENCETSAVGRALGFAGFGIDNSIASGEDVERNKELNKRVEIATNIFVKESDAMSVVKSSINELIRKMGIVKTSLELKVNEQLWTSLANLNYDQLKKLEGKLRTVNTIDDNWHDLYAENQKIKNVVPENQEVVYESSYEKLGKIALKMAGNNEELRSQIIDEYLNMEIDLSNIRNDENVALQ